MTKEKLNKSSSSSIFAFAWALFKTQLIVLILTIVVVISLSYIFPTFWAQVTSTLFGLYTVFSFYYSIGWSTGERDRNLVMYNHIEFDKLKGLKAGLISVIPLFILVILEILRAYTNLIGDGYVVLYNLIASPYVFFTTTFQQNDLHFLQPLICLIPPFFSWLGFNHGYELKEPFRRFIYTNPNKKKTNYHSRNGKKKTNEPGVNKVVTAATVQRPVSKNEEVQETGKKVVVKKAEGEKKLRSR